MASARAGFFLGFLGGAIISSQQGLLQKIGDHVSEALNAGKEAAQEKQDEMIRDFEHSKSKSPGTETPRQGT
jgi:hypothetical protein